MNACVCLHSSHTVEVYTLIFTINIIRATATNFVENHLNNDEETIVHNDNDDGNDDNIFYFSLSYFLFSFFGFKEAFCVHIFYNVHKCVANL